MVFEQNQKNWKIRTFICRELQVRSRLVHSTCKTSWVRGGWNFKQKIRLKHSTCKTSAGLEQNLHLFRFGRILFSASGPSSVPEIIPDKESEHFYNTVENFPHPKKNYSKITWIGTFCRGGKFSTFGGKFSTLVKFYFRHLDLCVCKFNSKWRKWKFFHFGGKFFTFKNLQKKKNLQNCMNWNILQRGLFHEKSQIFTLFH